MRFLEQFALFLGKIILKPRFWKTLKKSKAPLETRVTKAFCRQNSHYNQQGFALLMNIWANWLECSALEVVGAQDLLDSMISLQYTALISWKTAIVAGLKRVEMGEVLPKAALWSTNCSYFNDTAQSSHQINDPIVLTPSNSTDRLEFSPSCANKLGEKEIKEFLSS